MTTDNFICVLNYRCRYVSDGKTQNNLLFKSEYQFSEVKDKCLNPLKAPLLLITISWSSFQKCTISHVLSLLWMHLASKKEKKHRMFFQGLGGNTPLTQLLCREPVCGSTQPKLSPSLLLLIVLFQNESMSGLPYYDMPVHIPFLFCQISF